MTELGHSATLAGVVASFDEGAGLGTIVASDEMEYQFHCLEIADGSRSIAVGLEVSFEVLAKLGRYEASNIRS